MLLAWWLLNRIMPRYDGAHAKVTYRIAVGLCLLLAAANFLFIPAYELHECGTPFTLSELFRWRSAGFAGESAVDSGQVESYRQAAEQINRLTYSEGPLYVFGIRDALEPFVFYLSRCVRPLTFPGSAPSIGYVIATESSWRVASSEAQGLTSIARIPYDKDALLLLHPTVSADRAR
jgi:hypothetical protein